MSTMKRKPLVYPEESPPKRKPGRSKSKNRGKRNNAPRPQNTRGSVTSGNAKRNGRNKSGPKGKKNKHTRKRIRPTKEVAVEEGSETRRPLNSRETADGQGETF